MTKGNAPLLLTLSAVERWESVISHLELAATLTLTLTLTLSLRKKNDYVNLNMVIFHFDHIAII